MEKTVEKIGADTRFFVIINRLIERSADHHDSKRFPFYSFDPPSVGGMPDKNTFALINSKNEFRIDRRNRSVRPGAHLWFNFGQ